MIIQSHVRIRLNDTTNAFKAYRREVIDGCRPLIAPHFNLTLRLAQLIIDFKFVMLIFAAII